LAKLLGLSEFVIFICGPDVALLSATLSLHGNTFCCHFYSHIYQPSAVVIHLWVEAVLWLSVLYFTGADSELLGSPQCHSVVWSCL